MQTPAFSFGLPPHTQEGRKRFQISSINPSVHPINAVTELVVHALDPATGGTFCQLPITAGLAENSLRWPRLPPWCVYHSLRV